MRLTTQLLILFGVASSPFSLAVEIDQLTVEKDGRSFNAQASFVLDLPRDEVITAFTSFDRLAELNPSILFSTAETQADGTVRVSTLVRDCIAFFCRSVEMVEDVHFDGGQQISAEIVPELSDFKRGVTTWSFTEIGQRTQVEYQSQVTPDFWLPPLLGRHAIRKTLKRQISATANNLESSSL